MLVYDKGSAYDAAYKRHCAIPNIEKYSVRPFRRKRITQKQDVVKEFMEKNKQRKEKRKKRQMYMSQEDKKLESYLRKPVNLESRSKVFSKLTAKLNFDYGSMRNERKAVFKKHLCLNAYHDEDIVQSKKRG